MSCPVPLSRMKEVISFSTSQSSKDVRTFSHDYFRLGVPKYEVNQAVASSLTSSS